MHVELHLLQNVAPSNLNRDDTNTPKDCEFGGHRRARISSQAFKRAIRLSPVFKDAFQNNSGIRTKRLVECITEHLTQKGKNKNEAEPVAVGFVEAAMSKGDIDKTTGVHKTKVLLYLGKDEIEDMGSIVLEKYAALLEAKKKQDAKAKEEDQEGKKKSKNEKDLFQDACKEAAKAFKSKTKSVDIALFGRMMAEHSEVNIDAACQVAHAISTNKVSMEMDYYTAVDDLSPKEETGAGMLGFTGFNSSCFYRYATIDLAQLKKNLSDDTDLAHKAVEAFLRASVSALPTGKQNSMAAHNPPDAMFAVVRQSGTPVSLANAFCKPVRPGHDSDLITDSIKAMDAYWGKLTKVYGTKGVTVKGICTLSEVELKSLAGDSKETFDEVVQAVTDALKNAPNGEAA